MNIKVITRHSPSNYGSLLQSIATSRVLEELGHRVEIIDYQRDDERGMGIVRSQLRTKDRFSNPIKKILYAIIRYPIEVYAQRRFDRMRRRFLPLSTRFNSYEKLSALKADMFITGSDQVWGPTMSGYYDPAYFLNFVDDETPKVAFAASFGKTVFTEETISEYKVLLERYNKITVREDTAVDLINSWGLNNCIGQVMDPTLLLRHEEWLSFFNIDRVKLERLKEDYILAYFIHGSPEHISYALQLSKRMGKRILCVNPFLHKAMKGARFCWCPDVSIFLTLILNASFMITDSFHGTCFAINMNKQFIELLPLNGTSTRNQSLLAFTGLENRVVKDYNDYEWADRVIDYNGVNEILQKGRNDTFAKLKSRLNTI